MPGPDDRASTTVHMINKLDKLDQELEDFLAEANKSADVLDATDEIAVSNQADTGWRETANLVRLSLRELGNLPRFIERDEMDDLTTPASIQAVTSEAEKTFCAYVGQDNVVDRVLATLPRIWIADVSDTSEHGLTSQVTRYLVDGWVSRKILLDVCSALPATKTFVNVNAVYTEKNTVVGSLELTGMLVAELRKYPRSYSVADRIKLCERLLKHAQDRAVEKQIPMPALYKFASACLISRRTVDRLNQRMLANYPGIIITRERLTRSGKAGTAKYTTPTKPQRTVTASNAKHIDVTEDRDEDTAGNAIDATPGTFVVNVLKSAVRQPIQELSFSDTVKHATEENIDQFVEIALAPFSPENLMCLVDVAKKLRRFNPDDAVVTSFIASLEAIRDTVQGALEQVR